MLKLVFIVDVPFNNDKLQLFIDWHGRIEKQQNAFII